MGIDPNDDLSVAKQQFRLENYGLAERYFRRAVEARAGDAEAWLGLAASYDRLKRFDLADRAYDQLVRLVGPTPEVLNNQGFSYILRGGLRPRPRNSPRRQGERSGQPLYQEQSRPAREERPHPARPSADIVCAADRRADAGTGSDNWVRPLSGRPTEDGEVHARGHQAFLFRSCR